MKKYGYLAFDVLCICGALIAALYLRHGVPLIQDPGQPDDLWVVLLATFLTALVVLPLMRTHASIWRFTSTEELSDLLVAVGLVVLISNSGLFLVSRLEMVPRSVPPMHWALAVLLMGGSRLLVRKMFKPVRPSHGQAQIKHHVLVVGVGQTAELYLQFVRQIIQHEVLIEGFVDHDKALTNRMFQKHKILGSIDDLPSILGELHVHGIHISQVVLTQPMDDLAEPERQLLEELEASGACELVHFAKYLAPQLQPASAHQEGDYYHHVSTISANSYVHVQGAYPYVKRMMDIVGGVGLLVVLSPVMLVTALLVALDVGFPIIFWQKRPGLYGAPFHLYKFRTMRRSQRQMNEDRMNHKSGDKMRTSVIGTWLRRLRLDELPQIFHIITGTMSFVGPRPLLPDDQPLHGEVRLSVRPGVTGWAQIHGGDALTAQEKLMLDRWYIRHMSFLLDVRILLRTLIVVLKEDRPTFDVINALK